MRPNLTDCVRLNQRSDRKIKKSESGLPRPFSGRRSRRSVRSGYAFSHAEGFGRLITSGRIIKQERIYQYPLDSDIAIVRHCHVTMQSADSTSVHSLTTMSSLPTSPMRIPTTYALCTADLNLCTAVNKSVGSNHNNHATVRSYNDSIVKNVMLDCLICSFAASFHHCSSSLPAVLDDQSFLELGVQVKPDNTLNPSDIH